MGKTLRSGSAVALRLNGSAPCLEGGGEQEHIALSAEQKRGNVIVSRKDGELSAARHRGGRRIHSSRDRNGIGMRSAHRRAFKAGVIDIEASAG